MVRSSTVLVFSGQHKTRDNKRIRRESDKLHAPESRLCAKHRSSTQKL